MSNVKLPRGTRKIKIDHPGLLHKVMLSILEKDSAINQNKVHFWIISLNPLKYIDNIDLAALGDRSHADPDLPMVIAYALSKGSSSIILAQNRLRDYLGPTESDRNLTDYLYHVGDYLGIPVVDHLIFNTDSYNCLFEDPDWMGSVIQSEYYNRSIEEDRRVDELHKIYIKRGHEIGYEEGEYAGEIKGKKIGHYEGRIEGMADGEKLGVKKGRREGEKLGIEKGRREEKIETARAMKTKGYPVKAIVELTGLSVKEIVRLEGRVKGEG